ncbi:MAG: YHS domain protein [Hyphomicrobium sp.]|nr:MAG: YHS domain protein [Hyphomicrobium sp.]PPC98432.1 MAG: YHS domain protein [Hyphomicrobium sp.]
MGRAMMFRAFSLFLATAVLAAGFYFAVGSKADAASEIYLSGKSEFGADFAAGGYDVVAYHKDGAPKVGRQEFATEWKNATWRFSSAENLADFKQSPEKYAPQYGGYCAYGLAKGYPAHGDPKHWAIVDGKLYLNYNGDVQTTWNKDHQSYITAADKAALKVWPKAAAK